VAVQLAVEVCGEVPNVTLAGLKVHVRPAGVETDAVSATVPVSPLTAVTVTVDVPEDPARIWAGLDAPAAIVKSTTTNVIAPVV
jgi:hypothetical protein